LKLIYFIKNSAQISSFLALYFQISQNHIFIFSKKWILLLLKIIMTSKING